MKSVLITGGAGFFGDLLKRRLLEAGWFCVSVDLQADPLTHPNLVAIQGDIRNRAKLAEIFARHHFEAIFHCAAILAHDRKNRPILWSSNVAGTRNIAEFAKAHQVRKVVFTSSNCIWGHDFGRDVNEDDPPSPVEIYGRSKREGEKILQAYEDSFAAIILRCPTIIDSGRLGLLAILFEFIAEGRRVWVVGRGDNRYQFIYAQDLIDACLKAAAYPGAGVFNIGADHVKTLKEVYEYVIQKAGTGARIASLPKSITIALMKTAYYLRLSPLGPYHYRMIAGNFILDTRRIKHALDWRPTLTNEAMLYRAYQYFCDHREQLGSLAGAAAHKRPAAMGVIKALKWLS